MVRRKFPSQRRRLAYTYQGGRTLFSLPPEIRNRIWEYVVTQDEAVTVPSAVNEHLRFLQTCRQMYAEAYLMYFDRNRFLFYLDETSASQEALFKFLLKLRPETRLILSHNTVWWLVRSPGIPQTAPPIDHNFSLEVFFQQINSLGICFNPGWRVEWRYKRSEYTESFIGRLVDVCGWKGFCAAHSPAKRWIFQNLARHFEAKSLCSRQLRVPWSFLVDPNKRNTWRLVGIVVIDIGMEAHQTTWRRVLQMISGVRLLPLVSDTPDFIEHHPVLFVLVAKIELILQHLAIHMVVRLWRRIGARARVAILDVCHIFWRTLSKLKDMRSISLRTIKGGRRTGRRRKRRSRQGLKGPVALLIAFWPLLVCTFVCTFVCFAAMCSRSDIIMRTLCTIVVKTNELKAAFAPIAVDRQTVIALSESIAMEIILRATRYLLEEILWEMMG